jgi:large subunit ribosomal protein L2
MGKRIIQQARGKGSFTYRVKRKAFKHKIGYPSVLENGEAQILKLLNSPGHTTPLAKIKFKNKQGKKEFFYIPAAKKSYEEMKMKILPQNPKIEDIGTIARLRDIPIKAQVFNIESRPRDGGRFIRTGGSAGVVTRKSEDKKTVFVLMPSKKEKKFPADCRATIGEIAGGGRLDKPLLKAGKKYHIKRSKNKLWPRTSALKMNAIDHPFGSGRGKNPKSKIAKRNSSPGQKVGLLRPKRTGKRK